MIGAFNRIIAKQFPVLHTSLGLFFEIADAEGNYSLELEFCDSAYKPITKLSGFSLEVKSRKWNTQFGIQANMLFIPAPGVYFFRLYFDGKLCENLEFPLHVELER